MSENEQLQVFSYLSCFCHRPLGCLLLISLGDSSVTSNMTQPTLPPLAFRRCGPDGLWVGRHPNETSSNGWTNYTPCFPPLVQSLFYKVYDDESDAQEKFSVAMATRYMEIAGYSFSCVTILISLCIFSMFHSLRNKRTVIHANLFLATFLETITRLTVYIDQEVVRNDNSKRGIDNIPYLCESFYVLLEYSQSLMFTWMLIEGVYLHNMVTGRALRSSRFRLVQFCIFGWTFPMVCTLVWTLATAYQYKDETTTCWYGYNFTLNYFVTQGPRWGIIICNLGLLIHIMHVVVKKLKTSTNSDLQTIKKAARAALILLPLLGLTNVFSMYQIPVDTNIHVFALWCYTTHFLRSFQGCFISIIYCFINGEVRLALRKKFGDKNPVNEQRNNERPESHEMAVTGFHFSKRTRRAGNRNRQMSSDWNPTSTTTTTTNNVVTDGEDPASACLQTPSPRRNRVIKFADKPTVHHYVVYNEEDERPRTTRPSR